MSPEQHFSTPSSPEVKVPSKESTTISHSSEIMWQNTDSETISLLENQIIQLQDLKGTAKRENFTSLTTQHLRNRREIDAISESPTECANFTFTIKYEDEYKVWNNFSILYQNYTYYFYKYRVTDDGLQVCNSSDPLVQQRWCNFIVSEKRMNSSQHCNASKASKDYGVIFGHFAICSAKLSLSCDDDLIKIKYDEQYNVFKNFSLFYNKTMYDYREYRFSYDSLEMCASNDSRIQAIWRTRNSWQKFKEVYKCYRLYYLLYYTVTKQFTVYWPNNGQYFKRNDYAVIDGKPFICGKKFRQISNTQPMKRRKISNTKPQEDLSHCKDSIINITYDDEYKVRTNFSILYKNKVYDYTEYRVLNDGIKICNSTDNYVRNTWKERNFWVKATVHYRNCNQPIYVYRIRREFYTVRKDFSVLILPTDQVIAKDDYGVHEGYLIICKEKLMYMLYYVIIRIPPSAVASLCALALSIICLVLLLIVYCMLPELRTLPGLNLMSLSFAVLLLQTYIAVYLSLYGRVGQVIKIPCDRIEITNRFFMYSILMNAVVNIFHLRKTFCGNTLVKSDENKWKTFLKYNVFSWGVPLIITIVYIVLVKTDVLRFHQRLHTYTSCVMGNELPLWLAHMEKYGPPGCLFLCIIAMFSFTAYRIRQKLKASSSIAQKSNIVKTHNSFVLLLKLSTTTAISFFPLLFQNMHFDYDIRMALYTVALLSGVYIGIAFVFTRKNYRLLKKKYFPAKKKPVNKIIPVNQ
jgi:hypothetical protein